QAGKVAEQATHGRAAHTDDDDGILFRHGVSFRYGFFLQVRTQSASGPHSSRVHETRLAAISSSNGARNREVVAVLL
ncbi:hypothetical protein, partial [Hyphomonas sp. UBA3201]|uniref:hypothetical protein n=1 Tax=Hyphomonas sp. UBA3201 TaxID=1946623 RepID=UPI0025C69F1D